ncbi:hypothetical protein B0J13DRAFT_519602 [Dactylonectria estremocensis]|uniref:Uncharacterized protein n=1 Tax=Dactylonectria estremocensis TaxID=1079267 RepID=A0A9P9FE98_9HYPO|nr:hypothetical protein B0J13DRAFT_519602 [Dactylonectria estremocensis]
MTAPGKAGNKWNPREEDQGSQPYIVHVVLGRWWYECRTRYLSPAQRPTCLRDAVRKETLQKTKDGVPRRGACPRTTQQMGNAPTHDRARGRRGNVKDKQAARTQKAERRKREKEPNAINLPANLSQTSYSTNRFGRRWNRRPPAPPPPILHRQSCLQPERVRAHKCNSEAPSPYQTSLAIDKKRSQLWGSVCSTSHRTGASLR